jgi:hypothetical protein
MLLSSNGKYEVAKALPDARVMDATRLLEAA